MLMISAHCSLAFPPMSNRSCSPMMNLRRNRWCARSRVGQISTRSTSLRTDGRASSFGAGALSLDTMHDHAAELAEVGACWAVAQFTYGHVRPRGVRAARPSLKCWRTLRRANRSFYPARRRCGAGRAVATRRCPRRDYASAPLTAQGVASYAGVLATTQQRGSPTSLPNPFLDLSPRKRATAGNNDELAGGGDVVGGTLDVFRTIDDNVVPPIASSSDLNGTAERPRRRRLQSPSPAPTRS